jgi:hypothetical protein
VPGKARRVHLQRKTMMKTKFVFFCALIFLLLGCNSKDGVLFFFFAVHLLTLAIGVIVSKYDQKRQVELMFDPLPKIDSSKSQGTEKL